MFVKEGVGVPVLSLVCVGDFVAVRIPVGVCVVFAVDVWVGVSVLVEVGVFVSVPVRV